MTSARAGPPGLTGPTEPTGSAAGEGAVVVRVAEPGDYDALGQIVLDAYRSLPGGDTTAGYERALRAVAERAVAGVVLAAVDRGTGGVIGCVTYVPGPESPLAEEISDGEAAVRMLGVEPAAQRRGAGRALMDACIERARADGRERLVLHSTPWMTDAHRLYERLGFRRAPERDWSPVPDVPLLGFTLELQVGGGGEASGRP